MKKPLGLCLVLLGLQLFTVGLSKPAVSNDRNGRLEGQNDEPHQDHDGDDMPVHVGPTDLAGEDVATIGTTEPTTTKRPAARVQMLPQTASLKAEKPKTTSKPFSKNQQFHSGHVESWPPIKVKSADRKSFEIEEANAYCFSNNMELFLRFSTPFTGFIYPYHHFRGCHLYTGDGNKEVNLLIDEYSCGLDVSYRIHDASPATPIDFMEFTVMVQWDKEFVSQWDHKLRVTCNRHSSYNRTIEFVEEKPINTLEDKADEDADKPSLNPYVSMELTTQKSSSGADDAFDVASIGEKVELKITLHHDKGHFDAMVTSCEAHDGLTNANDDQRNISVYDSKSTPTSSPYEGSVALMVDGCSTKRVPAFTEFRQERIDSTLTLTNAFKVFRFPTSSYVFVECAVVVCHLSCKPVSDCQDSNMIESASGLDVDGLEDEDVDKDKPARNDVEVHLFRPIQVRMSPRDSMGGGGGGGHRDEAEMAERIPTASFVAGLIGMGFLCAIICVFLYRRFRKPIPSHEYKLQYNAKADKENHASADKHEVTPLQVTASTSTD